MVADHIGKGGRRSRRKSWGAEVGVGDGEDGEGGSPVEISVDSGGGEEGGEIR